MIHANDRGKGYGSCRRYPPTADPVARLVDLLDDQRYQPDPDDPGPTLRVGELTEVALQSICMQLERRHSAHAVWPRVHESDACGEYSPSEG